MSVRVYLGDMRIDDAEAGRLLAAGRAAAYGDGLFETMRAAGGAIAWWPAHRARLFAGARRLGIATPALETLETALGELLFAQPDAAIKLVLSRGSGGRGYASAPDAPSLWWLSTHPLPPPARADGLALRWCETRLSAQPALAGLKHCNRLEQVLARAEWGDADIDEGLMRDGDGAVIAAISANLFVLRDGRWWTPPVDRCGIAGVCRAWALAELDAGERRFAPEDVLAADALFLCNALRGILPVARLDDRDWAPHPAMADAIRRLAAAHPAFAGA